jgi:hypothetical protein
MNLGSATNGQVANYEIGCRLLCEEKEKTIFIGFQSKH